MGGSIGRHRSMGAWLTALVAAAALPAQAASWSLFNIEGESAQDSIYVTHATLDDMLADRNRVAERIPGSFAGNVVGSGSDAMRGVGNPPPSPVPAPGTAALVVIAAAALGATTRRRAR